MDREIDEMGREFIKSTEGIDYEPVFEEDKKIESMYSLIRRLNNVIKKRINQLQN